MASQCRIETIQSPAGKPVHWCERHGASATDQQGHQLAQCYHARLTAGDPLTRALPIKVGDFPAGVDARALVPPVYDTTLMDQNVIRGIHVHCRNQPGEHLDVHSTFRDLRVEVIENNVRRFVSVSYTAFLHFVVSNAFGLTPKYLECPVCMTPATDVGMWAVTPHKDRVCAGCGTGFSDTEESVANASVVARRFLRGGDERQTTTGRPPLEVKQADYESGIQVWAPEAAVVYSAPEAEIGGMHIHFYDKVLDGYKPVLEDNFSQVIVDGVAMNAEMMRLFIAQRAVPELRQALRVLSCPSCGETQFDKGRDACTPRLSHTCHHCAETFTTKVPTIANPILADLDRAAQNAQRPLQARFWADTV